MNRYLLVAFLLCAALHAQPPAPPLPQAPLINAVSATGARRGSSVELTLTGANLLNPTGAWTSFPAKVTIPADKNNGKVPNSLRLMVEIAKDAPLGFHFLRVSTSRGMSNARLFCIDDLPEVAEVNTNRDVKTPQAVTAPCVISGQADAEVTDHFKVSVKAGQRLSFEVIGRRLGSTLDPQITLLDAKGSEIAGGYNNDSPGLQTDARLTKTFKEAGDVIVAVRDASYLGGAGFNYRLRIGDFPCATAPVPSGIKRGTRGKVGFAGPNVEGVPGVEVQAPADPAIDCVQVTPVSASGLPGWPVLLAVSDLQELSEAEPNDEPAKANRITLPCAVTGRFEKKGDIDHFVFAAKKGQRFVVEAQTAEWGSPTDVYLALKDAKGNQVQASNPAAAARLDYTPPADGDYTVAVEHLHSWGGPEETYRLLVTPFSPDFTLTLAIDRFQVAPGGEVSVPVFAQRAGYVGAIDVSVEGPKGLSGKATIPAGPAKPPNVPSVVLQLKAEDLPPGAHTVRVVGKATINGQPVARYASTRALLVTALGNLPQTPREQWTRVGVVVTEKPPFTLAATADAPVVMPGKPMTLTVSVARMPSFPGEVVVTLAPPPRPGVTMAPVKVAPGVTSVKATVNLAPGVKPGALAITLEGKAKHAGQDWAQRSAPVTVTVKK